jgi:3-hydroxyethyl bacteriochlorophyllide a dehydrogenase
VLVDVEWTGISTGTEKLLYDGRMPAFPGMGYPLVPGYETVGRVAVCGEGVRVREGERVFVMGATCFGDIRGLFGGAASRLVVAERKLVPVGARLNEDAILLALAATAHHALLDGKELALPDLIVGHGVLGRLLARLSVALGVRPPAVWETNAQRSDGSVGYQVLMPEQDDRTDYRRIIDASGDPGILDTLIQRLGKNGEIVLAGFYSEKLSFTFPPAFMREARLRIAAEWTPGDLVSVKSLIDSGALNLQDLISHRVPASEAREAYPVAFTDPECLKMVLDWRRA